MQALYPRTRSRWPTAAHLLCRGCWHLSQSMHSSPRWRWCTRRTASTSRTSPPSCSPGRASSAGCGSPGDRSRLRALQLAEAQEYARRVEADAERERRIAAARDRTRIARELHDSAGHAINAGQPRPSVLAGEWPARHERSSRPWPSADRPANRTIPSITNQSQVQK